VQFDWDRQARFDGATSIWVRVISQWQGGEMGVVTPGRAGQMVMVSHVHGDPDRPIVSGFVVDKFNPPPWALPDNMALSGMRSRSLDHGFTSNHLALDDTPGKQQAQLASDHGKSSLTVGYNTRIDGNKGRQDARGEGFELRTDLWGVVRAARGMFITTHARANASGKAKDADETIARLTQARDMHEALTGLAQQHGAQKPDADQSEVTRSIKQQAADIRGTPTGGPNDFPELASPIIALSSPAGIGISTAGSTHLQSDHDTAITTGQSVGIAAGKSLYASVLETIALFVRKAGMSLVAAAGKIHIEAQSDGIDILATGDINIASKNGWINLTGLKGIRLNGAGTTLEWSAAGLLGATNGKFLVHAADHATDGPQSTPPAFPPRTYTDQASIQHLYHNDEPVQGAKFDINYADGKHYSGMLDSAGRADLSGAPVGSGEIRLGPDSRTWEVKANDANPVHKANWTEGDFAASASKQNDGIQ
jgi:type VI secretion system secreted protein VgrG